MSVAKINALARARAALDAVAPTATFPVHRFGIGPLDSRLRDGGLRLGAVHDIAAAAPTFADDAAATLFVAGLAASLAGAEGVALWICLGTDLYAPGVEQAGLRPDHVLYVDARDDSEALALAEDALADASPSVIIAETRRASLIATRRLQLGCERSGIPALLLLRRRRREACPLESGSAAATRWKIGVMPSPRLDVPGLGRAQWSIELVRQRGGDPFTLTLEACDGEGRLALPAAAADRAATAGGAFAKYAA